MTRLAALLLASSFSLVACGTDAVTPYSPTDLENLDAAHGFSLRVPEFELPPGRESQNCYFVRVPDLNHGEPYFVDRVLTAINPGSHHVNVFRVKTIMGLDPADGTPTKLGDFDATVIEGSDDYKANPCWQSSNWADWPLVANSQNSEADHPTTDWQLPENVAIKFEPGEMLMLQTHYVNSTDQPAEYGAKVGINFYRYLRPEPPQELGSLFATQQNIRICRSRPAVAYSGTCRFPNDVTITAANGHYHKRGVLFEMFGWDGVSVTEPSASAKFYESDEWDHPLMETNIARPMKQNEGIWWNCHYEWRAPTEETCDDVNAKDPLHANDCCYTFGGNTDVGEHCNAFVYYYPKVDTDVFCN